MAQGGHFTCRLTQGDGDYCPGLVAFNSVFQVLFFPLYAYVFATLLPSWLGLEATIVRFSILDVAVSVAIYLGIPFALGFLSRRMLIAQRGRAWFDSRFVPRTAPLTLVALLFTIVVMFSLQGQQILARPLDVARVALPLLIYFVVMFLASFWMSRKAGRTTSNRRRCRLPLHQTTSSWRSLSL